jgi:hypothetical protein
MGQILARAVILEVVEKVPRRHIRLRVAEKSVAYKVAQWQSSRVRRRRSRDARRVRHRRWRRWLIAAIASIALSGHRSSAQTSGSATGDHTRQGLQKKMSSCPDGTGSQMLRSMLTFMISFS